MKILIYSVFTILCLSTAALADTYTMLTNDLMLNNGRILAQARGDLNKDGLEDLAVAVQYNEGVEESRCLVLALGQGKGQYTQVLKSWKALMLSGEGGMFEPLESLQIRRNSLFLNFFGGSRTRWYDYYQFQYRSDGWYLIGLETGNFDVITGESSHNSLNFLTSKKQILKSPDGMHTNETWSSFEKQELVNLKDFDINKITIKI